MATEAGNQPTDVTALAARQLGQLCVTAHDQVLSAKRAYRDGIFDYEDLKAAAQRCLRMRRVYEKATGKKVVSNPNSAAQIAALLR